MASVRPGGIRSSPSKNAPIWAGEMVVQRAGLVLAGQSPAGLLITGPRRDHDIAAGRDGTGDRGGNAAGGGGVQEVQHHRQDHRHRFGQRDQPLQGGIGQDGVWVGQIPLQGDHACAGQQRAGVRDHHWVPVDVGHPAVRVSGLGDLVGVLRGGQPAADVDELPDALPGQPGDGGGQEQPVLPGPHRQQREHAYQA